MKAMVMKVHVWMINLFHLFATKEFTPPFLAFEFKSSIK